MPATSTRVSACVALGLAWLGGCMFDLAELQTDDADASAGAAGGPASGEGGAGAASTTSQSTGASGSSGGASGGAGGDGGAGSAGSGGSGGAAPLPGCADNERDAYLDPLELDIAACAGGFGVPGVAEPRVMLPECTGMGDTSGNPTGMNCSAANLCAIGFHICASGLEVETKAVSGQCPSDSVDAFWATAQSLDVGGAACASGGKNNVVGCGDFGLVVPDDSWGCDALTTYLTEVQCGLEDGEYDPAYAPWRCPDPGTTEAENIHKVDPARGGVLCCRD